MLSSAKAEQLLKEMIPTQLINDCRLSPDNDEHRLGCNLLGSRKRSDPSTRTRAGLTVEHNSIENGQITDEGEKPYIIFNFDEHLAPNVDTIITRFRENVAPMDALRRLGYDVDTRIKKGNWPGWFFLTDLYAHRVMVEIVRMSHGNRCLFNPCFIDSCYVHDLGIRLSMMLL